MSLLLLLGHADAQQVTPAGVPSSTGVPVGPRITQTGGPVADAWAPHITAALYERDGTLVTELADSYARTWQDQHDDTGTGSLTLQNDDPAVALADYGQVVRFSVDGIACFACLVERMRTVLALADRTAWDEPVAWWEFGGSGDDETGSFTLTAVGSPPYVAGPNADTQATDLDGSTQYWESTAFTPSMTGPWTVVATFRRDSFGTSLRRVFHKGSTAATDVSLGVTTGDRLQVFFTDSGGTTRTATSTAMLGADWVWAAARWDGTTLRTFIAGTADGPGLMPPGGTVPRDIGNVVRIGRGTAASPTNFFDGSVAHVAVFESALTDDRLAEQYAAWASPEGEMVESVTTLSGRGLLALWEEAVVEPVGGVGAAILTDTLVYNFAHPDYDYSSWVNAVATPIAGTYYPPDWPDATAQWIWDRDTRLTGIPAGECYFRSSFVLGSATTVEVWAVADDNFDLWLDGAQILDGSLDQGITQPVNTRVTLAAGTHEVGMHVTNLNALSASALATFLAVDSNGTPTATLLHTDATWRMLAYPPVTPGFTVGQVIRLQWDAAQARGALSDMTLAFTDFADSEGVPWDVTADIALQVGDDLLTVLLQLAESYVDLHMGITPVLYAYVSRGTTRAVTFEVGSNLAELVHDGSV